MTATIKVSEVSEKATEKDLWDFFSFSGEIAFIELKKDDKFQTAYVTFQEEKALDTATLLTGAVIVDHAITVEAAPGYQPPAGSVKENQAPSQPTKAADMISDLLAKGYILSKDAYAKAKDFDDKHELTKTASTRAAEIDKKAGISDRLAATSASMSQSMKNLDAKYQVSSSTKAALANAHSKISETSSQLLKNPHVANAQTWFAGAYQSVAKAATDVQTMAKEKISKAEGGKAPAALPAGGAEPAAITEGEGGAPPAAEPTPEAK